MPRVGFEPTISAGERQQTYALDRAATGTGNFNTYVLILWVTNGPRATQNDVENPFWPADHRMRKTCKDSR